MEIKDFGTTTMAELLVFKAERFIDSRIDVPLYYQDDIDSIFQLPSNALLKYFNKLHEYTQTLEYRQFKCDGILHNRGTSIETMLKFFRRFKELDEKNRIGYNQFVPDCEKEEFRKILDDALKAQEKLWEDF